MRFFGEKNEHNNFKVPSDDEITLANEIRANIEENKVTKIKGVSRLSKAATIDAEKLAAVRESMGNPTLVTDEGVERPLEEDELTEELLKKVDKYDEMIALSQKLYEEGGEG